MISEARQLVGDLAVATVELGDQPRPRYVRSPRQRLTRWYKHAEHWSYVAIAAGIAAEQELDEVTPETVAPLVSASKGSVLRDLSAVIVDGFKQHGHWSRRDTLPRELCMLRSGLEFVRELLEASKRLDLDLTELDHWTERARPLPRWSLKPRPDVPSGMPIWHWWWF